MMYRYRAEISEKKRQALGHTRSRGANPDSWIVMFQTVQIRIMDRHYMYLHCESMYTIYINSKITDNFFTKQIDWGKYGL